MGYKKHGTSGEFISQRTTMNFILRNKTSLTPKQSRDFHVWFSLLFKTTWRNFLEFDPIELTTHGAITCSVVVVSVVIFFLAGILSVVTLWYNWWFSLLCILFWLAFNCSSDVSCTTFVVNCFRWITLVRFFDVGADDGGDGTNLLGLVSDWFLPFERIKNVRNYFMEWTESA